MLAAVVAPRFARGDRFGSNPNGQPSRTSSFVLRSLRCFVVNFVISVVAVVSIIDGNKC